jgi:hypothetical protein
VTPFDLIGDHDIFHRDVTLALSVAEQLIATVRSPGAKSAVTARNRTVRLPPAADI